MSQYAVIPIDSISEIEQEYSIADPSTWQVNKDEVIFGGVEEDKFSQAQKEEIERIGGQWFANEKAYNKWLDDKSEHIVEIPSKFKGKKIKILYI